MARIDTVGDILAAGAADHPDTVAVVWGARSWTYRELSDRATAMATGLTRRGVEAGIPAVVALPNGVEFVLAFFAVLLAGGVAVPAFPRTTASRLESLARMTGAPVIVGGDDRPPVANSVSIADLSGEGSLLRQPAREPSDTCYIQYTSGSTADPRGVVIPHGALVTNIDQMVDAMAITEDDVFVSWLPTYHDMGLTLMVLTPLSLGGRVVLLPTELRDVSRWLTTIASYGGTFTAGPDFAYRLCVRRTPPPDRPLLPTLRVAMNASEPVRLSTLRGFEAAFGVDRVMMTGYGLAEATLSVTCTPPGAPMEADERGLVCLGPAVPGTEVTIVGDDAELDPGQIGRIMVRGPTVTPGYFGNDAATDALLWRDGYVRTGDTGYLDARGRLFFAARDDDMINVAGRSIYPQEVEEIVDTVRATRLSAAVGSEGGELAGEQLHVFAEVREPAGEIDEVAAEISRALHAVLGLRPRGVHLLRRGAIPLTENGKLRRGALRDAFRSGELALSGNVLSAVD